LVPSSKLPEFVHQIPAPDGIKFAHNSPQEYELVGDVEALELVDLDKEGLSEYKYFLDKSKSISNLAEMNEAIEGNERQVFVRIDVDGDGKVTREEAEKMFLKINSQLGRSYGEKDVDRFMSHLDLNNDGAIDFEEFKNAYHKLLN
jgi:Ca2+-binding EF-hand superfamily protein